MDAPNVIFYGDKSQVKLTRKVRSGLFSSTRVTLGFRYSLCLHFAFCHGPVDALLEIQTNNKVAFSGNITGGTGDEGEDFVCDARTIYGGDSDIELESGGFGGVYAACTFYKGTETQSANSYLESILETEIPAHRGTCHLVWKGPSSGNLVYNHDLGDPTIIFTREPFLSGYVGTSPNLTPLNFVLRRLPNMLSGSSDTYYNINNGDANPADILYELMANDEWGMGLSTSLIDTPTFKYAQQKLYEEGLGFSGQWDSPRQISEVIDEILGYIDGVIYVDLSTGLVTLKLARDDYDVNNLLTFDEDSIVEITDFSRSSWDETTNEVVVSYIDRFQKFKEKTAIAQDLANSRIQGDIISAKTSYVGISNKTIASKIAFRDLRVLSLPLARCTIKMNRKGIVLRPGMPFKLVWPDYDISQMVFRATRIRYGELENGQMEVDAVQDVFSLSNSVYGDPPSAQGNYTPPNAEIITNFLSSECPYFFSGEQQKVIVFAAESAKNQLSFNTYASVGSLLGTYTQIDSGDTFTPTGTLNHSYSAITADVDTTNTLTVVPSEPNNLVFLQGFVEDYVKTGENLFLITDGTKHEICAFEGVVQSSGNYVLSNIWRGLLDTVPQSWSSGARLWFFSYGQAFSGQPFSLGNDVYTKVESIVSGKKSDLSAPQLVSISGRSLRPYPPGYFRINGSTSTVNISSGTDITVTWEPRNRVSQGEKVVKQFQTDIADPEARTEYYIKFFNASNTLIKQDITTNESYTYTNIDQIADNSGIEPKVVTVQLFSRRDGLSSLYPQQRTLIRPTGTAPAPVPYSPPTDTYVPPKPSDAVSINGIKICTNTPTNGQALVYDSTAGCWKPGTIAVTLNGDVTGLTTANTVEKIRNKTVSPSAPTENQFLGWNNIASQWEPKNIASASSGSTCVTSFSDVAENLTANNTWTDITDASVAFTPPELSNMHCTFTCEVAGISANAEKIGFRFLLDNTTPSETWSLEKNIFPSNDEKHLVTVHTVFENIPANTSHSVKAQWNDMGSNLDVTILDRRITVINCKSPYDDDFLPNQVSGIGFWFEADQLTGISNNNPVNSILDNSGNSRHFPAFSTSSPDTRGIYKTAQVNGKPAIQFIHDGNSATTSNTRYDGTNFLTGFTEGEIFIIMKAASDPATSNIKGNYGVFGSDTTQIQHVPFTDGTIYDGFGSTARKNTGNPTNNLASFFLYNVSTKANLFTVRINGSQHYTTNTNTVGWTTTPRLGGQAGNFSSAGFDGYIAAIIIYNRVLNSSERAAVRAYCAAKYSV
ncbi:MAG TPA: phage tail protein [Leptospiraceae bacterium]|nr:phage tail protein [Leptospiraceae bacterium]